MSSKYSNEFKLKVLEYYFEHGGDKKFGNKARTANHFCIDHKTVSRMLCNPEMVKKARKLGKKNSATESTKSSKPNIKNGQPYVSIEKIVGPSLQKNQNSLPSSSSKSQSSKKHSHQSISEVPIIELPEDPDFSVLKSSIDSSLSSVSHVARLLITGNSEVKYIIANECDLIFECKVCRNLFRSVINFLAHKRNYCQEKYTNVRNLFHKDTPSNMTAESSTVFVEPEPPSPPIEGKSSPLDFPEALKDTGGDKPSVSKIDKIATQLGKMKEKSELASSSTHKGSSQFFKGIEDVNNARKSVGTDCTVVLKDIKDVSVAVYQSMVSKPEDSAPPTRKTNHPRKRERPIHLDSKGKVVEKVQAADISSSSSSPSSPKKIAATIVKAEVDNEEMEVDVSCNSCNSIFSSKKMLNSHIEETHGLERMVYTCPICNVIFLSIWGCVKHLVRVHKKKKHQRDRLKHVICSRAYKKVFTPKEIAKHSHKSCSQISKAHDSKLDESTVETSSQLGVSSTPLKENAKEIEKQDSSDKSKESNSRVPIPGTEEESTGFFRNKALVLPNTCPRCLKSLPSPTAMGSHLQICSLTPMSSSSETPEKKIAIQIRKDYKKDSTAVMSPTTKESGSVSHALVTGKEEPYESSRFKIDERLQRERIQERINEFCHLDSLTCIPCNRNYNTINILKRHVSTHFGWTRFSCTECPFRHYERYICLEHCTSVHKCKSKLAEDLVLREDRLDDSEDKKNKKYPAGDDISRKVVESLQNGGYASSECSATIISEDSVSIKSEFDSQETEKADVAYRELIEKTDDEALTTEVNNSIEIKTETLESNTLLSNNNNNNEDDDDSNDNTEEKKLEADLKIERPQRNRKIIEQKDFVYEPLRSPTVSSRSDENKIEGSSTLVLPRQRIASGQTVILKIDRSSTKRKEFPTTSIGEVASKKTCARVLTDINPHFSICNGQGGNTTVIARTVMPGSFDKSSKPISKDISLKKEPVVNRIVNNQSPTKLNCSPEQTVSRSKDQLPMERKVQLTGLKLKEVPDHRGNGDDSRNKTLPNAAKESIVDATKKLVVKKTEEKTESGIKDSSENVANENTLPVKKDSQTKLTDVEQLICRLKKRLDQNKLDNLQKKEISSPKPEEHQDRDLITNPKIKVIEPLNISKSISVIQIQTKNSERKRTSVITQPTNTLVMTSSVAIPSSPSPSSSSSLSSSSPSTSRPEAKIKIKVETKQEKDTKRDQTAKTDKLARKKSLDSKN